MTPSRGPVLGFDTSGAYCAAALFADGDVIAARHDQMPRGQAERLLPMLEDLLAQAGCGWNDLAALGVGVGPGNFTGVRISVAAARGLALALRIPAVGVSLLDALALGQTGPVLACLDARGGKVYLQMHGQGRAADRGPEVADLAALPAVLGVAGVRAVGDAAEAVAARLGLATLPAVYAPASAVVRIAARRAGSDIARPAPLYLRPADAAPPRDAAPKILP